ncbi:MAG: hypothetical protein ACK6CT_10125 [Planctomycetia bacterium]|jgi:hypothetical protein
MSDGYEVLAFAMDGELEGQGFWELEKFSQDLVEDCRLLLRRNGEVFTAEMDGELAPIELQFTSANGAALATFSVRKTPAVSLLLVSGNDANTDSSVMEMFIQSCRKSASIHVGSISANAFTRIREVAKRPCMSVVAWSSEKVSDDEFSSIQELSLHLGAAYFYPQMQLSRSS